MTKKELWEIIIREGDKKTFMHNQMKCMVWRDPDMLHWCGYVYIPLNIMKVLNKANPIETDYRYTFNSGSGITYVNGNLIGFDCAHLHDLVPYRLFNNIRMFDEDDKSIYRTKESAIFEVKQLTQEILSSYNFAKNN